MSTVNLPEEKHYPGEAEIELDEKEPVKRDVGSFQPPLAVKPETDTDLLEGRNLQFENSAPKENERIQEKVNVGEERPFRTKGKFIAFLQQLHTSGCHH